MRYILSVAQSLLGLIKGTQDTERKIYELVILACTGIWRNLVGATFTAYLPAYGVSNVFIDECSFLVTYCNIR